MSGYDADEDYQPDPEDCLVCNGRCAQPHKHFPLPDYSSRSQALAGLSRRRRGLVR